MTALLYLAGAYVVLSYVIAGVASTRHLRRARHVRLLYVVWAGLVVAAPVSVPVALAVVALESRRAR